MLGYCGRRTPANDADRIASENVLAQLAVILTIPALECAATVAVALARVAWAKPSVS
jgi:hypothetical protein